MYKDKNKLPPRETTEHCPKERRGGRDYQTPTACHTFSPRPWVASESSVTLIEQFVTSKKDSLLRELTSLIEIPSVKGEPAPNAPFGVEANRALLTAIKLGEEKGFLVSNYDGYVATIDFSTNEPGLDILAHLDVVPAPPEKWTVCSPFSPIIKDGKIYGRGSSDDKGPALAALLAMECVKALGVPLKKNVRLILGVDEESGSLDIEHYYSKNTPAPATFSPDGNFPVYNVEKGRLSSTIIGAYPANNALPHIISAAAGSAANVIPDKATAVVKGLSLEQHSELISKWEEKTGLTLTFVENGTSTALNVVGTGGHAAHPQTANNALTGLLELLSLLPFAESDGFSQLKSLASFFPHGDWLGKSASIAMADEVSHELTLSLNIFQLDETGFAAQFDSRTPICANKENTINVLDHILTEAGLVHQVISTAKPHYVSLDSPFVQTLLNAYERYSGLKGHGIVTGGGTYVHGIENAVSFGASLPHTDNNIHGADEFAVIDELLLSAVIFAQVIIDICGQ